MNVWLILLFVSVLIMSPMGALGIITGLILLSLFGEWKHIKKKLTTWDNWWHPFG